MEVVVGQGTLLSGLGGPEEAGEGPEAAMVTGVGAWGPKAVGIGLKGTGRLCVVGVVGGVTSVGVAAAGPPGVEKDGSMPRMNSLKWVQSTLGW